MKEMTNKEVRQFMIENMDSMDNDELAKACNRTRNSILGHKACLSRHGLLPKLKITTKKKPNKKGVFKNVNGKGKVKSRDLIFKHIYEYFNGNNVLSSSRILTLCADTLLLEERIAKEISSFITFDCVDYDLDVYFNMLEKIAKLRLRANAHYSPVFDIIKRAKENEYDALILDYCGQLDKYFKDLKVVLTNDIVKKGGTISLTFDDRCGEHGVVKNINNLCSSEFRGTQIKNAIEMVVLHCGGINYEVLDVLKYKDTTGMINVIIRRKF